VEGDELPRLDELERRATANGVSGVERLGPERLREIEPHARGLAALWVPQTGIVSFKAAAEKMAQLIRDKGGRVECGVKVLSAGREGDTWLMDTSVGMKRSRFLVNCGGLHSDRIAAFSGAEPGIRIVPFRGEYYTLSPKASNLIKTLIYPVPDASFPFLGVHFTPLIEGGVEAGPNAVWALKREGYRRTDISLADAWDSLTYPGFLRLAAKHWRTGLMESLRSVSKRLFLRSLRRLVPEIGLKDLQPGSSGVRAQALEKNGALLDDFRFVEADGALHVLNAPSPAATASLPIGRHIAERIRL
jgi:L-2-hydroxyglutarate oxidase